MQANQSHPHETPCKLGCFCSVAGQERQSEDCTCRYNHILASTFKRRSHLHIFLNSAFRSFGICVLSIHGLLLRYSQTRGLHIRPWDDCLLVPLLTHWAVSMAGRWPQLSTFGVSKFGPGLPMLSLQNYHPGWTSESSLCIATEILMVLFWWLLYRVGNLRFFVTGCARQDPPHWETWSWNGARIFFPICPLALHCHTLNLNLAFAWTWSQTRGGNTCRKNARKRWCSRASLLQTFQFLDCPVSL